MEYRQIVEITPYFEESGFGCTQTIVNEINDIERPEDANLNNWWADYCDNKRNSNCDDLRVEVMLFDVNDVRLNVPVYSCAMFESEISGFNNDEKYFVDYEANWMLTIVDDIRLYAEVNDVDPIYIDDDGNLTIGGEDWLHDTLKSMIIEQAKENNIDVNRLTFYYD